MIEGMYEIRGVPYCGPPSASAFLYQIPIVGPQLEGATMAMPEVAGAFHSRQASAVSVNKAVSTGLAAMFERRRPSKEALEFPSSSKIMVPAS